MSCSLLFCLSNLYVNVELSQVQHTEFEGYWCDSHWCEGPQADIRVVMPVLLDDQWLLQYGFKHTSFPLEKSDKGQNVVFMSVTWSPFK